MSSWAIVHPKMESAWKIGVALIDLDQASVGPSRSRSGQLAPHCATNGISGC